MIAPQPALNPVTVLSPLAQHKYRNTPGKQLLFDFMERFLSVEIIGFQEGFRQTPDQILFRSPRTGSTLSIPCSVMLLQREQAVEVVQSKIKINERAFL
jgi:hypothetical protein